MTDTPPTTRKRGRPKGSKNKSPPLAQAGTDLFQLPLADEGLAFSAKPPHIIVASSTPVATVVFDTYWRFACERQSLFFNKIRRPNQPPWTDDPILRKHKFTNAYRASDRVSQYLIRNVINCADTWLRRPEEIFFRTLLFKFFNKIETWERLEKQFGAISWAEYDFDRYDAVLTKSIESGQTIYSAAYIMPSGRSAFGHERKHRNHLMLLEKMMGDRLPARLHQENPPLSNVFETILTYPGIGNFLAYQYAIDLNYTDLINRSEDEFVVPGPGALDGIAKCFSSIGAYSPADVIRYAKDQQETVCNKLGISFPDLWGHPLHLIDCQNLFCEVDKYARVKHPEFKGRSDRSRIKQIYRPSVGAIDYFFPVKWGINERIAQDPGYLNHASPVRG
ncbi:MAG: nucleotide kinase domain-containing protein [Solirubrobacterales bacterium]